MQPDPADEGWERAGAAARREPYVLRLYVTGLTPRSSRAVAAIRALCEEHLPGRYELVVVDLYREPARARAEQVVATPTLVKRHPAPVRRLVGDLADTGRVLAGLGLRPRPPAIKDPSPERSVHAAYGARGGGGEATAGGRP